MRPDGQLRHFRDQLSTGRIRPERRLRVADGPHEAGVPDEGTSFFRHGEPGEHQPRTGRTGRLVELHRPADHATSSDRLTEHPAEETLRLDHIDLPVQREYSGTRWTCHQSCGVETPDFRPGRKRRSPFPRVALIRNGAVGEAWLV